MIDPVRPYAAVRSAYSVAARSRDDPSAQDRPHDADADADDAGDGADLGRAVAAVDPVRLDHRHDRELAEAVEKKDGEEHAGAGALPPMCENAQGGWALGAVAAG